MRSIEINCWDFVTLIFLNTKHIFFLIFQDAITHYTEKPSRMTTYPSHIQCPIVELLKQIEQIVYSIYQ